jgi:quercetin dioxygenase-like cupin family protein
MTPKVSSERQIPTGSLQIVRWAIDAGIDSVADVQQLAVSLGPRPISMEHSSATGEGLVSNGVLGGDIIRLAAGEGFVPHTHPGDHLLIVIGGSGTITYGGTIYPTRAGEVYMIEGGIPHAVGAITDHVILAIGSPHRPVDAKDRMQPVEYKEVTAELDSIHCLICSQQVAYPDRLHDRGCPHCPCPECVKIPENSGIVAEKK